MDRVEERPSNASSPSGAGRTKKGPVLSKSNTLHHRQSFLSPAKEPYKAGNGGGPAPGAASVKSLCKHLWEDPPMAWSDASMAPALRRSSSLASRSGKAAARWGAGAAGRKGASTAAALKVVFYSTSLRGIRRTYEDCCTVRNILRGFRVAVDERDVSMDASLRRELQGRLGGGAGKPPVALPQVFVGDRWVGGAEEIRQMHESGDLAKLLEGVPRQDPRFVCRACGGVRFVPCGVCSGSRKLFDEEDGQLRRCPDCNENGLVRCADCS